MVLSSSHQKQKGQVLDLSLLGAVQITFNSFIGIFLCPPTLIPLNRDSHDSYALVTQRDSIPINRGRRFEFLFQLSNLVRIRSGKVVLFVWIFGDIK